MKKISVFLLIGLMLLTGCISHKFNFPDDIDGMCHGAKNESKARINSVGVSLKEEAGCRVGKMPGEKKFSGKWGWRAPEWDGMWVLGLCGSGGTRIIIGCHPQTLGEVDNDVLIHEFAHYWLMSNYDDYTHDPKYVHLFYNWRDPRLIKVFGIYAKQSIKSVYEQLKEGETLSVIVEDKEGKLMHIDFIKGP